MRVRAIGRLALEARRARGRFEAWRLGLYQWRPNYAIVPAIPRGARVVDVGAGDHPDFAAELARAFAARCLIVDPTLKHAGVLQAWCERHQTCEYLRAAVGSTAGRMPFFESRHEVSGSLLRSHPNIADRPFDAYDVAVLSLSDVVDRAGGWIDVLKLDIEGAEFDVLERSPREALTRVGQIVVEFHDGTVPEFTIRHRRRAIARLLDAGFKAVEYNGRDVLFFRPNGREAAANA